MYRALWIGFVVLLQLSASSLATPLFWWTETSPHDDHGASQHSHGGPVEVRRGVYHKNLWLRSGPGTTDAQYVAAPSGVRMLLENVKGETRDVVGEDLHGAYGINFAMPDEGFYNLYLISEAVVGDEQQIHFAKAEVLKHSCREGHDHVKPLMAPRTVDDIPLEIVRERADQENFHSLLGFGDNAGFLVLYHGKPLADAEVTLHTARGWRNTVRSDASGRARFTLIRDYYPPWHEFERRHRQEYLVHASYTASQASNAPTGVQRTLYSATLNGSYYPSPRDYRSYAYGLLLGVFALTFSGVAVYLYRRRRQRLFREVRFDVKD